MFSACYYSDYTQFAGLIKSRHHFGIIPASSGVLMCRVAITGLRAVSKEEISLLIPGIMAGAPGTKRASLPAENNPAYPVPAGPPFPVEK